VGLWFDAIRYRLIVEDVDPAVVRHYSIHTVLLPLAFAASIGLSYFMGLTATKIFWVLIVVVYYASPRLHD
jgi:hypothetical protein